MDATAWITLGGVVVALAGVGVALGTVALALRDARRRDDDHKVDRALELYRDLVVEGDTAAAFNQLSVALRRAGSDKYPGRSTWVVPVDDDLALGRLLGPNPDPRQESYFQDVFIVLWFFERARICLDTGIVDRDILFRTIGYHCWWWGQLLLTVTSPKASTALHYLARQVEAWAETNDVDPTSRPQDRMSDWLPRCRGDFENGPPQKLNPP